MVGSGWGRKKVESYVADALEDYQKIIYNNIGVPGGPGFGVGVCPADNLPSGFTPMSGYADPVHENYGNYQYADGSVMVYVPKFYFKVGTGANGLAVNVIDVKPADYFADTAAANTAGYGLPTAFVNGGQEQPGFFVDKYKCSKAAWGTGYIASSIKNGNPISTASTHNPIADLTACAGNYYYEAITAAKARDGINGEINSASRFFCKSRFIMAAMAILSLAHGQAANSAIYCAWYDSTGAKNYPKGCNNDALKDIDDTTVSFTSDGYLNCGKTGSGLPFAKTTHNGQNCGIADVNGLMWDIEIGLTCIAVSKTITAATQANPCQLTITGHGQSTGAYVDISSVAGMTQLNDKIFKITVVDENTITLDGVDSAAFGTYTSGGTAIFGTFYKAKNSIRMEDFTAGNSLATDHWGATGVAAMMEAFVPAFETVYPNNGYAQRMGSGSNQVLSEALTGNASVLTNMGFPKDAGAVDTTGTNLFGKDYFYQKITNDLCLRSGGSWSSGAAAGVWNSYWDISRAYSSNYVGFRCACYPV